jgi:4-amino-4-deoxychorismate lyase
MSQVSFTWVDGTPAAAVPAIDRGLQYGDGLFESMRVRAGQIRFIEMHLDRLYSGATRLGLNPPRRAQLRSEWQSAAAQLTAGVLKFMLTRGDAVQRGYSPAGLDKARRLLLGYADVHTSLPDSLAIWHCAMRLGESPSLAGMKTLNRLEQVLATDEWQRAGAAHGLALHEGLLSSSSGALVSGTCSNIFWRSGTRLLTPQLDRCGVAGVMRRVVMREADALGFTATETIADTEALLHAEEVFMTNIRWQVLPVSVLHFALGSAHHAWPAPGRCAMQLAARICALDT